MNTEREAIEAIGAAFRIIEANLKTVMKINTDAGRDQAANAVFGILGAVMVVHSDATADLHKHWPEFASEVQALGPGGR